MLRADALRQVGQLSAAIPIYQGLLGSAKDGAARYGLGRVAAEQGDFRSAAQQMEQARMSNPVDSRLLTDLGYAYLRARDLNAARIPLMQAAQLHHDLVEGGFTITGFAENGYPIRGLLPDHFRSALATGSSQHDSLP